jgi:hypothetical protein
MNTQNKETIESILAHIKDQSLRIVAEASLVSARKALDMSEYSRLSYVVDEIHKIMPKALKARD